MSNLKLLAIDLSTNRRQFVDPGSGGGATDRIKVAFAYGDASPAVIATFTGLVLATAIVITVPFDGVGASLQVGDAAVSDRLLLTAQVDPTTVATYEADRPYTYSSETQILLTINPGSGATQGAGYVVLEV